METTKEDAQSKKEQPQQNTQPIPTESKPEETQNNQSQILKSSKP